MNRDDPEDKQYHSYATTDDLVDDDAPYEERRQREVDDEFDIDRLNKAIRKLNGLLK